MEEWLNLEVVMDLDEMKQESFYICTIPEFFLLFRIMFLCFVHFSTSTA